MRINEKSLNPGQITHKRLMGKFYERAVLRMRTAQNHVVYSLIVRRAHIYLQLGFDCCSTRQERNIPIIESKTFLLPTYSH